MNKKGRLLRWALNKHLKVYRKSLNKLRNKNMHYNKKSYNFKVYWEKNKQIKTKEEF